jgi:L-threonylcarbamoyladenylate synthase
MPSPAAPEIVDAADVLRRGGLVAFPTETVYGLGAAAVDPVAVARVFAVKGRPADHPLIVHVPDAGHLERWATEVPAEAWLLAEACWPGPLTVVLRRAPWVPAAVTGGRDTVALRVPAHPVALALLAAFGDGVAAPSANRFGRVSPTTAAHVRADLGDEVDVVLDGGSSQVGVESTIVDLSAGRPEVLRLGAVTPGRLEAVLGAPVPVWHGQRPVAAPGTLASHYAPDARVELVEAADVVERAAALAARGVAVAVLAPGAVAGLAPSVVELGPMGPSEGYARALYDRLRLADRLGIEVVLAVAPDADGVGAAVADRLLRAAARAD